MTEFDEKFPTSPGKSPQRSPERTMKTFDDFERFSPEFNQGDTKQLKFLNQDSSRLQFSEENSLGDLEAEDIITTI